MNTPLLWVVLTFGLTTLFTYVHLAVVASAKTLLEPIPLQVWIPSMVLTVTAFIFITVEWIWTLAPNDTVVGMYCLFFAGACLWAPLTMDAQRREIKSLSVFIALWLTATGSIGIFALSCAQSGHTWLQLASCYVMLHHVILDGCVWYARWEVVPDGPYFSMPARSSSSSTGYTSFSSKGNDNLEYI